MILKALTHLEKSFKYSCRDGGLLIFEKNGKPDSFLHLSPQLKENDINELKAWCSKFGYGHGTEVKVIGSRKFLEELTPFMIQLRFQLLKSIQRESEFEIVYNHNLRSMKVSKESANDLIPVGQAKIKVLIVDDSQTIRQLLEKVLCKDHQIEVVGTIANPLEVEAALQRLKPDVMTLDIHMPEMDGVSLLKKIIPTYKIPTVMISSISKEEGPQVLAALEAGAVDYIQKPSLKDLDKVGPQIIESVKMAAKAKVTAYKSTPVRRMNRTSAYAGTGFVVIGSSTGGTEALRQILEALPAEIPPIMVVQHIPAVFSKALADRLNDLCPFQVKEVENNDLVKPNTVYIAQGGMQMSLKYLQGEYRLLVNDDPPVNRHKPSVDYFFKSVSQFKGVPVVGVILTGMGADGARMLKVLRDQGARTIAQDKETSVVWGMPREAAQLGGAEFVLPIYSIAEKIVALCEEFQHKKKAS
jgi:two-component system chemotaxis response regulator CheB